MEAITIGTVISLANLKGGVGKTASTVSIAGELVEMGASTLIVDTDPQGGATSSCGANPSDVYPTIQECMEGEATFEEAIITTDWGTDLLPARLSLAFTELQSALGQDAPKNRKTFKDIKRVIRSLKDKYDFLLVDTPPAPTLSLVGAVAASEYLIIPIDCKPLAVRGLQIMFNTLEYLRSKIEADPKLLGILPTMYRKSTLLSAEIVTRLKNQVGDRTRMFSPVMHSVRFSELPRTGGPICHYEKSLSEPYKEVAQEVMSRVEARPTRAQ